MEGKINQDDNPLMLEQVCSMLSLKFERLNIFIEDDTDDEEIEKDLVTSQFRGRCNNCGKYGHKKQDLRSNDKTTRAMTIQAKKIFLMEPVITATSLDIRNHIDIRNRGNNKQILMELVINATSLDISNKIAAKNKGTNKQISQRTKK